MDSLTNRLKETSKRGDTTKPKELKKKNFPEFLNAHAGDQCMITRTVRQLIAPSFTSKNP